ncbi:MAG: IS1380 family transposase [Kiritimatiellae bacterium]|nr:IS1380 family transposase [Kiritimatiellia bacterium]MCO5068675.1 IS1380 family transposase [Kiritimatiellia bacterium]MCO5069567.1 IS1380 family transposase [Kiritimatiellia bacterium]
MTICTSDQLVFPSFSRRKVQVDFEGGDVSSDGGVLLLRQMDRRLKLTQTLADQLPDAREASACDHAMVDLLRQRIYGIALGYEDGNDHLRLRQDVALQTAVERVDELASPATLCRWENRADRKAARIIHELLVEQFIASYKRAPKELILDFDATDDAVHGQQEGRFFHGYYDQYCFLPLYVFCGTQLLVSYLRPSNMDPACHAWAVLSLLVKRLRKAWPEVKIIVRGDSGFCRWRMMRWCDRHDVLYVLGLAQNTRLNALASKHLKRAEREHHKTGRAQRFFKEFRYAAQTWDRKRRVILRAEHTDKGSNPRYIVTNMDDDASHLYDTVYCARGEMENRIKEQQLDLFSDRTSCSKWWANQFRLLLSSLAYVLVESIRRVALQKTELARATCGTIRLKLLKIGAVLLRNTRRVRLHLSSAYPYRELFHLVCQRLSTA